MENRYSVLMSVYYKDNPEFLEQSIKSMLNQTIKTDDFVLICDGSLTDSLNEIIERYTNENRNLFHVIRLKENVGLGNALNIGIQHCKNDIVARMDSDDIACENRCKLQLEKIINQKCDIVSGTVAEFSGNVLNVSCKRKLPANHEDILNYSRRRCPFNHPCVMYKKNMVMKLGGYEEAFLYEDYYLWVKLLQHGAISYNIPDVVLYMRAGNDMYRRRGGLRYAKSVIKFRWKMKNIEYINWYDFFITTVGQVIICCLPNKLRKCIYENILRNK